MKKLITILFALMVSQTVSAEWVIKDKKKDGDSVRYTVLCESLDTIKITGNPKKKEFLDKRGSQHKNLEAAVKAMCP